METLKRSLRLDDEVMAWIETLPGRTVNDKLRGLMSAAPVAVADSPALLEVLELVRDLPDSNEVRGIVAEMLKTKPLHEYHNGEMPDRNVNHCAHCYQDFSRPLGTAPASMCVGCAAAGHWRSGTCQPCAKAAHLSAVAANDVTGNGRADIEYDPAS